MNLFELNSQYQEILEQAANAVEPEEQQAFADTLEGIEGEIDAKVLSLARVVRTLEAQVAAIKAEKERLDKKQKTVENSVVSLKAYMMKGLKAAGQQKVQDDTLAVAIRINPVKVVIEDESKIPDDYKTPKVELQIDKGAIKAQLAANIEIPGAHLERGERLDIR